jgi:hypothetical protein
VHTHILYCDDYKLSILHRPEDNLRFFDLGRDPNEQTNLAGTERTLSNEERCLSEYQRLLSAGRFTPFDSLPKAAKTDGPDDATLETLRSLGYAE